MTVTKVSANITLKIDLSDHPLIKDDIFEVTVTFPPRGTPIGIIYQYCEHHNMYYVSNSKNNSPWNGDLTAINIKNASIIIIGRKETISVPKFTKYR